MKVRPVQAYGLAEFERTGQIIGAGTDDLEGYEWLDDGRHYGPGEKPRLPAALRMPPDMPFTDPAVHRT
jgi:epoxyqueuosine reductase